MKNYQEIIPAFKTISGKKLVGLRLTLSFADNRTATLWQQFMPRRKEIANRHSSDHVSMSVYGNDYFTHFNPGKSFEKWAAAEVTDFSNVPEGMETYEIPAGLYAVFHYRGPGNDPSIFSHIFGSWLPGSGYDLDNRPHFEIMGENYRPADSNAEEEIWIPVKPMAK